MKHLYRVVRCPKGTAPGYLPWHHLWLALGLTALGLLLGLAALALTGLVLWVVWFSLATLWSVARGLLP